MAYGNSQRALHPAELSGSMNGTWVELGSFLGPPTHVIYDNQGDVPVAVSFNGGTDTWKTFKAGQSLVMDYRSHTGKADSYGPQAGPVHANGASGTFRVSYVYPKS